ncbi:ABC transporter substrate-binding protein [Aureimonas phyllosphaerae]|uniref:Multiple sugar transport system substrate-binding protein/sorbitol/mannitol transport system substrate-binding protein n=1 Tax=Aureimonas phyllosphaerae TaxID=1166078 RepID=A0A7W6BVY6_9HYPH|nr:sugar ABC transporter substrate-binding protein [Aureimonas phyllosphaerae]MBB3937089.1 multiple sugar transport system substrate-binding protein/sorbitol/mannitol transport system substrate-binding protein [Aureimonas phyllosphaerae]MBB3960796.1 multiple sugar transport system substrate-binding protein/sorbitol/mannitol transport system substrate-binding protein [Aureimonas phyllosphaerae]SFF50118.1 carbohydrate ABC transporter substrate-binding protein, CUT1 family [Aureimonas phyllosphaera
MINRRNLLAATAAVGMLAAFPEASVAQDKPFDGVQLSVLMEGHPTTDAIGKMLPEFTEATGIDVALEVVPEQDITAKTLLEFSSRSGRYDVVQNNIIYVPGFVASKYIVPMDETLAKYPQYFDKADFVPGYFNTNVVDGKTYGLPVYGESTFLMYRKDLFQEYGLSEPKSFEDMEAAAKTVSEETNKQIAGITMRGRQGIEGVYVWAAYLWGFGGSFLDASGKSALATPEGIAALDAFTKVLRDYGPVGVANFGWEENRLLFQQGKAAMTLDATVNGAFNEDPTISAVAGKVGYVPVPMKSSSPKGGSSSLAVHSLYVNADSQNQEAAAVFAAWATAKEQQLKSMETDPNSGVTSLAALNGESFGKRYGAFKDAMLAAIEQGNPQYLPTIDKANEVINNTGIAVSKALAGAESASNALKEADTANNAALAR